MLTKWAKKILSMAACNKAIDSGATARVILPSWKITDSQKAYIEAKNVNGSTIYIVPYTIDDFTQSMITKAPTDNYIRGVMFGSGKTSATENDYALEQLLLSGISASSPSPQYEYDSTNNVYRIYFDYAITNNTGNEIEINEIGYWARAKYAQNIGETASSFGGILLDRTVLDNTVTIPNGEAATVRYEFDYGIGDE